MRQTARRRSIKLAASLLAVAALGPASASAASCAAGDRSPAALGDAGVRHAVLCLLNGERTAHGLRPLRHDERLGRAAVGHSRDMAAHHYFAHDSRSGATFGDRIARTGWMRGRRSFSIGENLAWGTGESATPRAIVTSWMHSAGHRENILDGRFRVIGIGVVGGVPVTDGTGGATYTTDFGT